MSYKRTTKGTTTASLAAAGMTSGGLLVLSLPKPDLYALAWIALVPLLVALNRSKSLAQVVLSSYLGGVVFFAGTFYWITETMMIYGGLSAASAVGVGLLFSVVYALHFVLFAVPVWLAIRRWGSAGLLSAAPVWVAVEFLRTYSFSGFPWMLSGYALVPFSGLLQVVTWTGVYGLSFIATFINSGIAFGLASRAPAWTAALLILAVILSVLPIPSVPPESEGDAAHVRIVQTNISLDQPWQEPAATQLLYELSHISTASPGTAKLVVWPETPAPFYVNEDPEFRHRMQTIARESNAYVLVGYIDRIADGPTNSAALIDPRGDVVSRYDKIHLVPFGEYVPLMNVLSFAKALTHQVGDFKPGSNYTVSDLDGHRLSTAICYESIFPDLVRQFVLRGSQMLVVITNDGWFGESSAPYQHLRMGVVRAVENRRYEVRDANTGISAIIDPYGRIQQMTPIGRRVVLDGKAYFRNDLTFYTKHGDVFAYVNVITAMAVFAASFRRKEAHYVRRSH